MAYLSEQLRRQVAERAVHCCEYCRSNELITGGPFHVDHVRPETLGGITEADNLAYALRVLRMKAAGLSFIPA